MLYKDYLDFLKSPQKEAIYITEHEQCITLGKNSLENEILIKNQIPVFNSTRGGGATYHGPGQLMVYPYFSLKKQQIYISDYINLIHDWGIKTLKDFGIEAYKKIEPGLWVDEKKVMFIGLAVKNGMIHHGASFNLENVNLKGFSYIIPCKSFESVGKVSVSTDDFLKVLKLNSPFNLAFYHL